jgi:hypothetical protein
MTTKRIAAGVFLVGLFALAAGCGRGPREGEFDRDHHRYYHEHEWHDCVDRDEHCR